jgi:hypothetical protein
MRQRLWSRLNGNLVATLVFLAVLLTSAVVALVAFGGGKAAAVQQVNCGDTITTDTTLHKDLVNCPNIGIVIGADNITLDLNYHRIDGDAAPCSGCHPRTEFTDIGVLNDGHDGVTVVHGSMRQFDAGAVVGEARHNRVLDISSSRNRFIGIVVFDSARSVVRGGEIRALWRLRNGKLLKGEVYFESAAGLRSRRLRE